MSFNRSIELTIQAVNQGIRTAEDLAEQVNTVNVFGASAERCGEAALTLTGVETEINEALKHSNAIELAAKHSSSDDLPVTLQPQRKTTRMASDLGLLKPLAEMTSSTESARDGIVAANTAGAEIIAEAGGNIRPTEDYILPAIGELRVHFAQQVVGAVVEMVQSTGVEDECTAALASCLQRIHEHGSHAENLTAQASSGSTTTVEGLRVVAAARCSTLSVGKLLTNNALGMLGNAEQELDTAQDLVSGRTIQVISPTVIAHVNEAVTCQSDAAVVLKQDVLPTIPAVRQQFVSAAQTFAETGAAFTSVAGHLGDTALASADMLAVLATHENHLHKLNGSNRNQG